MRTVGALDLRPESLRHRIRWLLLARVLVVTAFLGSTALTHLDPAADPDFPLAEVAGLIAVAYAISIVSAGWLRFVANPVRFAYGQVATDVLLISAGVLLTGGLRSPMAVWYNLAILGAGIMLLRRGAWAAALFSTFAYGSLTNLVYYGALPEVIAYAGPASAGSGLGVVYQIAANIASFFSIAYLASFLVDRLSTTGEALEQAEENLRRAEELQKVLVQNLESGVITTDPAGRIESANVAMQKILGKDRAELTDRNIVDLFPALRRSGGGTRLVDLRSMPTELTWRPAGQNGTGEERVLRCRLAPLTDTYQNPIGNLFIFQDVTQLRELETRTAPEDVSEAIEVVHEPSTVPTLAGMLGQSPRMREAFRLIEKVAPTGSTVLITGESGTGKELAARSIHLLSPRRDRPLVAVNCAAIPENLIESELFGHVRGAFTGAVRDHRGQFRVADGGTIFLDEVGELPLPLQVKLLRVLQERAFTPVGAQAQVVVDVRVIAATNADLDKAVAEGRFRQDLYYRLNVIRLEMPPLRDRREDLPVLIQHFVNRFSESLAKPIRKVGSRAMKRLLEYSYPGNIRELENLIEHGVALASGDVLEEGDLPEVRPGETAARPPAPAPFESTPLGGLDSMQAKGSNLDEELQEIERHLIAEALEVAGGIRKKAARILGINYRSLRHRLSKYGFDGQSRDLPS